MSATTTPLQRLSRWLTTTGALRVPAVTAVFWALKKATPNMSQAEFDEFPVTLPEMLNALPVIMRQVGFLKAKPEGEQNPGEAPAVDQSTGT